MKKLLLLIFASVAFVGCSKDDKKLLPEKPLLSINEKSVTLFYDESFQIEVKKENNVISNSSLIFSSSDENVGMVSASGLFEANKLGETTITVTGEGQTMEVEITVKSYGVMFEEPVVDFSSTRDGIKRKEKRKLSAETAGALLYEGENANIEGLFYTFKNNKLSSALVIFAQRAALVERLGVFYGERYEYAGASDDLLLFRDDKNKLLIGFGVNDTFGLSAMYIENTSLQALQLKAKAQMGEVKRNKVIQSLTK